MRWVLLSAFFRQRNQAWRDYCCLVTKLCPTLCKPRDCIACQAPLTMGFLRQKYWSVLPFPSPGDLPDLGIKPTSPALAGGFFTTKPPGKPLKGLARLKVMEILKGEIIIIYCSWLFKNKVSFNNKKKWWSPHTHKTGIWTLRVWDPIRCRKSFYFVPGAGKAFMKISVSFLYASLAHFTSSMRQVLKYYSSFQLGM